MAGKKKTVTKLVLSPFKVFLYMFLVAFVMMIFIGYSVLSGNEYKDRDVAMPDFFDPHDDDRSVLKEEITKPIILWWTGFTGEPGHFKRCGDDMCYFTIDRHYYHHPQAKVFVYYGSDFNPKDVPLPRKPEHEWALLHEESPKNNYIFSFTEALELFNHTATFSRHSDYTLVTQAIEDKNWLENTKYLVPTAEKNRHLAELAPVLYVQSDCFTPADRDNYVEMLMKQIKVDSYGTCLHNKELPKHLVEPLAGYLHNDFYSIASKYKFTLAMENAHCDDYVTEKLWRPLMLGSVPIISGSSTVRDILPDNYSAIIIEDFKSVTELAKYLKYLNSNDEEYEKYLQWKRTGITNKYLLKLLKDREWSITNTWVDGRTNYVDSFECFLCNRVHENEKQKIKKKYVATEKHFGCPKPMSYDNTGVLTKQNSGWFWDWKENEWKAKTLRYFADRNVKIEKGEFNAKVSEFRYYDNDKL